MNQATYDVLVIKIYLKLFIAFKKNKSLGQVF